MSFQITDLQVIQLYETFNVRFGVMLVGPAGGGKTEVHKTSMTPFCLPLPILLPFPFARY